MVLKKLVALAAVCLCGSALAMPKEINISYVKSPFNLQSMVMHERKMLEQAFSADGVKVNWHLINSGAQQTQAMAAGSLDIGGVMNTTSVLLANAGGNPVYIAAGVSRPGKTFALVSRPGEKIDVRALKGKKVAGPRGTVLHQLLVAALVSEGMSLADVDFLSMDIPKAQAALLAGHVDAALLAAGPLLKSIEQGARVVATAEGVVNPVLVVSASKTFAEKYPQALARVLKVHREATLWVSENREAAIAIGAREQGISLDDARKLAEWSHYADYLGAEDFKSLAADMQFLLDNKMMKGAVDLDAIVLPTARRPAERVQ